MKWVKEGIVALIATAIAVFFGPKDWLSIVYAVMAGIGVSLTVFGALLLRRIHKIDRIPLVATKILLIAPWFERWSTNSWLDYALILLMIAASLTLAHKFYTMLQHEAGEKDNDLRKGGYEVWK